MTQTGPYNCYSWILYDGVAALVDVPINMCSNGNGTTELYIVAHNLLRAHAEAVRIFRKCLAISEELGQCHWYGNFMTGLNRILMIHDPAAAKRQSFKLMVC